MDGLHIGLIGYGEVGRIFGAGERSRARWVGAWDLAFDDPTRCDEALAPVASQRIDACSGVASLCARATLVISAATASNTLAVACDPAGNFSGIDWTAQGAYFFSRVAQHGQRRAEEIREVAHTVREAGFDPFMATATAQKHDWMAAQARAGHLAGLGASPPWQAYADRLLAQRGPVAKDDTLA